MTARQRRRVCPSCGVLLPITRTGGRFRDHEAYPLGPRCAGSGQVAPRGDQVSTGGAPWPSSSSTT